MQPLFISLFIFAAYIYLRAVRPLHISRWWKAAAALLLALLALRYYLLRLAGGSTPLAPHVPAWALNASAVVFLAFLIFFCGVFGLHLIRMLAQRRVAAWRRLTPEAQQSLCNKAHLALLPVALLLGGLSVLQGTSLPRIRHESLAFPSREPIRIALISDLHISRARSREFVQAIVDMTNAQQPDLIAIVGDFVDGSPEECADRLEPLADLRAPLGVFGVPGNHDYYSGYGRWRPVFEKCGVRMLDNEHVLLERPGIVLAGVTDETASKKELEPPLPEKALRGAPAGMPVVLLAHRPIVARDAEPTGVRLQLSGHLHGGLVWGLGSLVAALDAGYRAGLYQVGRMQLYVSQGAGNSTRTPMRLGVPPEIVILSLIPQAGLTHLNDK